MLISGVLAIAGSAVAVSSKIIIDRRKQGTRKAPLLQQIQSTDLSNGEISPDETQEVSPKAQPSARQVMGLEQSDRDSDAVEKQIDRYLGISLSSLGIASVGLLTYPPLALLSLPGLVYTAVPIFQDAYENWSTDKKTHVALVDSLSVGGALASGYFFAASLGSSLLYFSQKVLVSTQDRSRKSLISVFGEQPRSITIARQDGTELEIPFERLELDDIVVIDAGQMIAIDGIVTQGVGTVDQRALTGESQPVEKEQGTEVFASTLLIAGRLYVRVEKAGKDTVAAQIGDILDATADFHSTILSRGQKIVEGGATPTLVLSAIALPILGIQSALAVLFSSFGFNMRISAPISVLNFLRITSEQGILVKDGRSLELLSQVDTVVFDKTGTLTEEIPSIGRIHCESGWSEDRLLELAASAEQKQTHPLALAILREANNRALPLHPLNEASYEIGYGLKVRVAQHTVHIGSARFMTLEQIPVPSRYAEIEDACHADGHSLLYLAIDNQLGGVLEVIPTIRPESAEIISELQARNIETVIISGDQHKPTQRIAELLGVDRYFAEVLPQDKAQLVEQLQQEGRSVCFVGDGINDSIALKTANVGISMSGASTIATDTAGIVLMDGTLRQFIPLFDITKRLDTNLTFSTAATIIPGIMCIGGVFFFNLGLVGSIMIFNASLLVSVGNAFLPLMQHQAEKLTGSTRSSVK